MAMGNAENNKENVQDVSEQTKVRRDKLADLRERGKDPFAVTKYDVSAHAREIKDDYDKWEGKAVTVAGRLMFKRVMGKASFCNLSDRTGSIQVYVARDAIGEEWYKDFKKMDIGDLIGVKGEAFTTKTGEISIKADEVVLLAKSLQVLPEKFHGLKDTDTRYRQRYLDLIVNPEVKETFIQRSLIIKEIRRYLDDRAFIEVETPVLVPMAGGAAAKPFLTHYNSLDQEMKLRISLELYLKRLIVGGLERVYEIGRVFRNEGLSTRHSPEYTLLELYQAYTDVNGMMDLTEGMIRTVVQNVLGTGKATFDEVELDFEKPFERITMVEAVKKHSGVDFGEVRTLEDARKLAKERHVEYEQRHKKGEILNLFFEKYVEEHLVQPTFVLDYPVDISPLAKRKQGDEEYTERFELFISKREIANAFTELNDPIDQKARFEEQEKQFSAGDEEAHHMDEDFICALEYGMPPTGGLGIGVDRLVMLLTDSYAIRDVLLFPTLKIK